MEKNGFEDEYSGADDDFYGEPIERIPYDQVPISRDVYTNRSRRNYSVGGQQNKAPKDIKWQYILISFLLIVCIILSIVLTNVIHKLENTKAVYNLDVNINSEVASDVLNATTKAKFSAVCVNCGNSAISTNGTNALGNFYGLASRGSGVILEIDDVAKTAYILTCYHVVQGYSYIYILPFASGTPIKASLINYHYANDTALLKIENSGSELSFNLLKNSLAVACEVANSSDVVEGQTAIAIGNALNAGLSASSGIVGSPVNFITVSNNSYMRVIRIDTPINHGNSGGGLFDINGRLIGLVNAKREEVKVDNVAFAIPSNLCVGIANSIKHYGKVVRPKHAVLGIDLETDYSRLGIDMETGAVINAIVVKSVSGVAEVAGVMVGDTIVSIQHGSNSIAIKTLYDVEDYMYNVLLGETIQLTIMRGNEAKIIDIIITEVSE